MIDDLRYDDEGNKITNIPFFLETGACQGAMKIIM